MKSNNLISRIWAISLIIYIVVAFFWPRILLAKYIFIPAIGIFTLWYLYIIIFKAESQGHRLGVISHAFLPKVGGLELYTYRLARDLAKQTDYQVEVLTTNFMIDKKEKAPFKISYFFAWPTFLRSPLALGLFWHLATHRYEVFHLQSIWFWPSFYAALLKKGAKIITTVHGVFPEKTNRITRVAIFFFTPLARFILRRSDRLIVLSDQERQKLINLFHVKPDKIVIIPAGIETAKTSLSTQKILKKQYHLENAVIILFTGRLISEKNPQLLIEVFPEVKKKIPNAKLVFIGPISPKFKESLLMKARSFHKDVIFVEPIHPLYDLSKLANFYAMANLFVSLGEWEGMPARILEAKFYHLPIIETIMPRSELSAKISAVLKTKPRPDYPGIDEYLWPHTFRKILNLYQ